MFLNSSAENCLNTFFSNRIILVYSWIVLSSRRTTGFVLHTTWLINMRLLYDLHHRRKCRSWMAQEVWNFWPGFYFLFSKISFLGHCRRFPSFVCRKSLHTGKRSVAEDNAISRLWLAYNGGETTTTTTCHHLLWHLMSRTLLSLVQSYYYVYRMFRM